MTLKVGSATQLGISAEQICDFYRENWNRKIPLSDLEFFKWQFLDVPTAVGYNNCCVAVDSANNIAGVMGANAREFVIEQQRTRAAELTTWIVSPQHQKKGIGPKIINHLKNEFDILLGLGITDSALSVYLRSGFRFKKAIPRFVKIIDWEKVNAQFPLDTLPKKISQSWNANRVELNYNVVDFTDYSTEYFVNPMKKYANFFARDFEYLSWRYLNHPRFNYFIKTVSYQSYSSLVVFRIDDTPSGIKMMHVTDIIGDYENIPAAIQYIEDYASNNAIDAVDFYTTNVKMHIPFLLSSWFSINDDTYFKFPHLFHPLELREPASTSMVIWSKDFQSNILDFSRLYISKQDCDLDRPSS